MRRQLDFVGQVYLIPRIVFYVCNVNYGQCVWIPTYVHNRLHCQTAATANPSKSHLERKKHKNTNAIIILNIICHEREFQGTIRGKI